MIDLQLIPTLPTLAELLGPDWETRTLQKAREALAEALQAWPRNFTRQVDESLYTLDKWYSPSHYHAVNKTLGELGQWREVLQAGAQIYDVGPTRRKILNRLFEVADIPVEVESLETTIPMLAELLGARWEDCSWDEAMNVAQAWFNVNPSKYFGTVNRLLLGVERHLYPDCRTLGAARERLSLSSTQLPNVGEKGWRMLYHLFAIPTTLDDATGQLRPFLDTATQSKRLEYLFAHLSEPDRDAWISLGRRMLPQTATAPTDWTGIQPQLSAEQITLWLSLGEQMLQRATREDA